MKKPIILSSFITGIAVIINACGTANNATMSTQNNMNVLTKQERSSGWRMLFDGKSTAGWHTYGKSTAGKVWKAENGTLFLDAASKKTLPGEGGDIVTNQEFENFHLKLDWRISPKGNSGIIFFVNEDPAKYPNTYNTGPEMQVLDNDGHADGKISKHRTADLYDLISVSKENVKPVGEWNTAEIVADKGNLTFYLNGEKVVNTTMWNDAWRTMLANSKFKTMPGFGSFKKGKIALQDHGDDVWFRNIKIREL